MRKIAECDRCQRYEGTFNRVCTLFPDGPATDECLDFAPNAASAIASEEDELWFPRPAYYNGELVTSTRSSLTRSEQLEILATHPLFTGRCPQCHHDLCQKRRFPSGWNCDHCDWNSIG